MTKLVYIQQVMTTRQDTRPLKKRKQHDKQHHNGGEAARPSSSVDLTNLCKPKKCSR